MTSLLARLAFAAATVMALLAVAPADASLTAVRPAPTDPVTFFGHGGYSSDGADPSGSIRAQVPAGSTVEQAYLYGSSQAGPGAPPLSGADLEIVFDGATVTLAVVSDVDGASDNFQTIRGDVTAEVAAKVGGGGGVTSFTIGGVAPSVHGLALIVIYSNPAAPEVSIALLDGFADPAGDEATLYFADPLDMTRPGFRATMALGIGWSAGTQSDVDVNGTRLTSAAGDDDDGNGNSLITVGGIGDSFTNPADPFSTSDPDDELYNLGPFLTQGDAAMTVDTVNASQDDAIFVSVIEVAASAGVGTNGALPPAVAPVATPKSSSGAAGAGQTVTLDKPFLGSVSLLDGPTAVSTLIVAGVGTYALDTATAVLSFSPVAGFSGTAPPIRYRLTNSASVSSDSTYTATVVAAPAASPDAPDTAPAVAPSIGAPRVTNSAFLPGGARAVGSLPHGTRFKFRLSERANVTIRIRRASGKRVTALKLQGRRGMNSRAFAGRVDGRALRPGRYVALLRATDSTGLLSAVSRVRFRILAAPPAVARPPRFTG